MYRFISADSIIAGVSEDVNGYNLFEYCNNNPINQKDASGYLPELTNNQKIAVGLAVITTIAVVGAITVATAGVGAPLACTAYGMLNGAIIGSVSGAASEAVMSGGLAYLATGDAQAAKQAAIDGAADGFMWGSITGAVTGGMKSPHCFVAGTLVCTADGEVPIEDIEVGDYVLAEDPETGEIDYKPVLETYEHDTYDVVYLTIEGEEFTTTEGHPFYTLERGFVKAGELRYSDTLIDDNGNKLHLEKKNKEHLSKPVTVYNFAVEDYHTYFVGVNEVLVHNMCSANPNEISKNSVKHILNRHSFANFAREATYLTDQQLTSKLVDRTFFNKSLSNQQIIEYVQEAYSLLLSQNKIGATTAIKIHGEIINVAISSDGALETAFGIFEYVLSDFR